MRAELEIYRGRSLSDFTTYRIGGSAEKLIIPRTLEQLKEAVVSLKKSGEAGFIIGGGSNLLISDRGLAGSVILMAHCCREIESEGLRVRCGAGAMLGDLVRHTIERGIMGAAALSGIPGTLGGALRMNAGAYGSEICDFVKSISVLSEDGEIEVLSPQEAGFSYRSASGLEDKLIIAAEFRFDRMDRTEAARIAEETLRQRASKHPLEHPSAGSVFKKHPAGPAGKFIEEAGLKGMRVGGAEVSVKHANFIVNLGGARAIEVLTLIRRIQRMVKDKFGIELELEQKLVGFTLEELEEPERFL